jgi:hypothetical protein
MENRLYAECKIMSEELNMEQIATEDEIFSRPFCLDYYGKGVHFGVSVAKPIDEFSGGVCLPHFLGAGESEIKKWYTESSYTSVELMLPEKEKIERLKTFLSMGLPVILAVYAAYGDFDVEEVRKKLPNKKAPIIGLGSYYSGRGKSMLGAVISHLRPDVEVVNGGFSQGNTAQKYADAITDLTKNEETFDFSEAVEKMKISVVKEVDERTDTVKDVLGRLWSVWFENTEKEVILVDLPGRSEIAKYSANSFGLLRYSMATLEVIRENDEGEAVSAMVDISSEELEDQFLDFQRRFDKMIVEYRLLEHEFDRALNLNKHDFIPSELTENSKLMSKI